MCPSLIQIGSKTADKNSAQTNKQTNRHYENNGHLAVNQKVERHIITLPHQCYTWCASCRAVPFAPVAAPMESSFVCLLTQVVY